MKKSFCKRIGTSLMVLSLVVSNFSAISVSAEENTQFRSSVTYKHGAYTFDKLSHPDKAVSTPDGIVDYISGGNVSASDQGQGDQGQSYSWSAVAYGDWVYVGTCYAAMGNTLTLMKNILGDNFDQETMTAALKAMYNGTFFYGHEKEDGSPDIDSEGILVKVNVKTGETKLLMSETTTGEGPLFRNAIRFKDKLYFCGSVRHNRKQSGLPSIYCVDPATDTISCVYTGLTAQESIAAYKEGISTGIRGMAVYNDELIVSCVGLEGPYILKSTDPSAGKSAFTKIATKEDLFDYPAYHYSDSIYGGSIWEIVEFNGHLYVALCTGTPDNKPDEHTMQSFAIVRGDENTDGSWTWTPVVGDKADGAKYTFGIDPERTRAGACNLLVYNDHLYIGEYEDIEIALEDAIFNKNVEFLANNLEQSVSLYRMDKDENMELVVGDATSMFPDGGTSGIGSGFGHHENQYIWQSTVYDGKMFFGTFDSSSLLEPIGQFTNGDLLKMTPEEWKSQINYLKVLIELILDKNISYPIAPLNSDNGEVTDSTDTNIEKNTDSTDITNDAVSQNSDIENEADVSAEESSTNAISTSDISSSEESVAGNSISVTEEDQDTTTSAYDMVQSAIAAANERYNDSQIATYANSDETTSSVTLSDEQISSLMAGIEDGSIRPNLIDATLSGTLIAFNKELDSLTSQIDEEGTQEFITAYSAMYDLYETFTYQLPENVKSIIDDLITITKKDNLIAFGKVLKYLSTAKRGFDLYVSADGSNFETITTNGFNDPYNHGLRVFATGDDWMVIGTANPFYGTQLWELRNYDPIEPVKPVDPVDPVTPVTPVTPITPVNPVTPSNPLTPVISGKLKSSALTPAKASAVKSVTASKTGDTSNPIVLFAIAGGALVVILGAVVVLRKKKH